MLTQSVRDLVYGGFTIVPPHIHNIPVSLIEDATAAQKDLIQVLAALELGNGTAFSRPGEAGDFDIGLIHRTKERGKDIKYFLHYTHELTGCMLMRPVLEAVLQGNKNQFSTLALLHKHLNRFVTEVLLLVEEMVDSHFLLPNVELVRGFQRTCQESIPYSVSVLRGLLYLASEHHVGAGAHLDRDFLTAHLGDFGGTLLGHREFGPGQTFEVSPKSGHILLFWGIRAALVSMGLLRPLYHSATANPGEDRGAMVQFCNLPWPRIPEWELGMWALCRLLNTADFGDWYQEKWRDKEWAIR